MTVAYLFFFDLLFFKGGADNASPKTLFAPAFNIIFAIAFIVEPVVITSSTRMTVLPITNCGAFTTKASLTFCSLSSILNFVCGHFTMSRVGVADAPLGLRDLR